MLVINFFAGPCAGKSTCAAELFAYMKRNHYKVELATEFAKDMVYEGMLGSITQEMIFAQQHWCIERLRGHVDYVITDSPILLSAVYKRDNASWVEYVQNVFNSYKNYNVFVTRPNSFQEYGRAHSLEESLTLDGRICDILRHNSLSHSKWPTHLLDAEDFCPEKVVKEISSLC